MTNWRQVLATSSMVFAVMLLLGALYLHTQKRHHLGRLNVSRGQTDLHRATSDECDNSSSEAASGIEGAPPVWPRSDDIAHDDLDEHQEEDDAEADDDDDDEDDEDTRISFERLFRLIGIGPSFESESDSETMAFDELSADWQLALRELGTQANETACLGCLCEILNKCRPIPCDSDASCGIFGLTLLLWEELKDETRNEIEPESESEFAPVDELSTFQDCAENEVCSALVVLRHFAKRRATCPYRGELDCSDLVRLYLLDSPASCPLGRRLPTAMERHLEQCVATARRALDDR